jgi:hypothetical protein
MIDMTSSYTFAAYRGDSKPNCGTTELKIMSFAELPQGWHYGDGSAIQATVIRRALRVCADMIISRFSKTDAFPRVAGDVRVTAYAGSHYLQVDVHTNGSYSVAHEVAGDEKLRLDEVQYSDVFKVIRQIAGTIWSSSDSSIQVTTTLILTGSKAGPLISPQTAEPQSLRWIAQGIPIPG